MLILAGGLGWSQGFQVNHNPPLKVVKGDPLRVEADIVDSPFLPRAARLYYRTPATQAYTYAEMEVERYHIRGEIPASATQQGGYLEYYFWIELMGGGQFTWPEGMPEGGEPYRVEVFSPSLKIPAASSSVTILHPEPGSTVIEQPVVIAVSLLLPEEEWERFQFRLLVDGKDLTSSAQFSAGVIALSLPRVGPGQHLVQIYQQTPQGLQELATWSFRKSQPGPPPLGMGRVRGEVVAGSGYEVISENVRSPEFLDLNFNGSWRSWEWGSRVYLTSLERSDQQPLNRYTGSLSTRKLRLVVGDAQPKFSEFTIWGVRTRGYEFNFRSFAFNLDVAQGELRRSIEGRAVPDTIYVTDPSTGDTLPSQVDPTRDSVRVEERLASPGTYRRNLLAIRPGFPLSDNLTLSLTALKVKDEVSSINWGRNPQDNLVIGSDITYNSPSRRVVFTTETAVSLFNRNIASGPMEDAKMAEKFIVVNQYFEPLPTDSSILEEDKDPLDLAKSLWSEVLRSSLAHRTTLTLNYFHNELKIGYKSIGRSFRSLGSPTVLTDVKGFSLQDRVRLLKNRLYFTLGYESYQDNVNGRSPYTTRRNIVRTGLAYYPFPPFPSLNFSFSNYGRTNNGEIITAIAGTDTLTQDTRIDSDQRSVSLGLEKTFLWGMWNHLITLNLSQSSLDDQISRLSNNGSQGINVALLSLFPGFWEVNSSFSYNTQNYRDGMSEVRYIGVSSGGRYFLIPNRLTLGLGLNASFISGEEEQLNSQPSDTTAYSTTIRNREIGFNRLTVSGGVDYTPHPRHQLSFSFYRTFFSDQGSVSYWDGSQRKAKELPGYIDQSDLTLRLVYRYRLG